MPRHPVLIIGVRRDVIRQRTDLLAGIAHRHADAGVAEHGLIVHAVAERDDLIRRYSKMILRKHPQDRILFGSDYPLYDPGDAMMHLQEKAELGDAALDRYCSNADALFA